MPTLTINSEAKTFAGPLTVATLLAKLGRDPAKLAVEVNLAVVPRAEQERLQLNDGDAVEIVTLVGGGSEENDERRTMNDERKPPSPSSSFTVHRSSLPDKKLQVGKFVFESRLFTGTGKYSSLELMRDCM